MSKKINIRKGFTLLEMIISLGIFMMFMTAVMGSYLHINDLQKKTNLKRENIAEARELINFIDSESKEKAIDYSCYSSSTCPFGFVGNNVEEVSLISKDGLTRTIIRKHLDPQTNTISLTSETHTREKTDSDLWVISPQENLHSPSLQFQDVTFQISPNQDPFSHDLNVISNNSLQYQPILHINLNIKRQDSQNEKPIILETSISSRLYHSF